MLKRVLMFVILVATIASFRGSNVQAHLAGTVYRPTYRHIASYDCTGTFGQVPNLDQHPALFECVAVVYEAQVVCANPQGKIVKGVPSLPRTVTQIAENFFQKDDLTDKTKGKAKKTLLLPDNVLTEADALCAARNRNWHAADELVLAADVTLRTFDCLDEQCSGMSRVPAFEALLRCTVPKCPNGELCSLPNNPPPGTPENPVPWDYDCELLQEEHCDQGGLCPIPPVRYPYP